MEDTIKHQGTIKKVSGSHIFVEIIQTSACSSCSIKGHCSSADRKEKMIEVTAPQGMYQVGDEVLVVAALSMGTKAVILAFVVPFLLLVLSLFLLMTITKDDLLASLGAFATLVPYYLILWLNKSRLKQQFLFTIKPINN